MTTITQTQVRNGDAVLHVEQRGTGPDVLLLCGLSDPLEVWHAQAGPMSERFRITVHDNRGVGRTIAPVESITVPAFASDAAAVVEQLGLDRPHVMGFSGAGMIAQELAITRPELVRSLVLCTTFSEADELMRRRGAVWAQLARTAASPERFLRSFLAMVYSRAPHEDGRVDRWIEEALAFPHQMTEQAFVATVDAYMTHSTAGRLHEIDVPTLVIAGAEDLNVPASYCRDVADGIPGAELVVLPDQGHQPFHEIPEEYNALVTGFWERVSG